jgi:glycosyltransferase involved in cell wall biosynthesis
MLRAVRPIALRLHKAQPADVVLGVNLLPDGWAAVQLGRVLRLPVVVNAIGSDVNIIPRMGPHTHRLACEVCRQADLLLCQSQAIRQNLLAMGADPQRTLRFWRGLDLKAFGSLPDRNTCRAQWSVATPDEKLIVFVGQLTRSKGVLDLLAAFEDLGREWTGRCRLALVGEPAELPAVLQRAQELGIADRLVVTGPLDHEQALRRIRAADMLVLPSYAEGMPNVVLEAMALGTSVVASRAGALAELAAMEQPFFDIEAGDVVGLTRCLRVALGDPQQAQAKAARAQRVVQEHFDVQKNCRQLLDIMKGLTR